MVKKLKVLYLEVGKKPKVIEIDDTLEAKQDLVGGLIEVIPYRRNLVLICNEEGKINELEPNLNLKGDIIVGNCFIVGDDYKNAGFKSITDEEIKESIKDLHFRRWSKEYENEI